MVWCGVVVLLPACQCGVVAGFLRGFCQVFVFVFGFFGVQSGTTGVFRYNWSYLGLLCVYFRCSVMVLARWVHWLISVSSVVGVM